MKWTTEQPTVPGWYWHRMTDGLTWMEQIEVLDGRLVVIEDHPYGPQPVAGCTGEWAGPIPEPEEA